MAVIRGFRKEYRVSWKLPYAISLLMACGPAAAQSVGNIVVRGVGVQGPQIYAQLSSIPPGCAGAIIYNSVGDQSAQYVMSVLMSARLSQRPLSRIDYSVHDGGSCWIRLVEM